MRSGACFDVKSAMKSSSILHELTRMGLLAPLHSETHHGCIEMTYFAVSA